MNRELLYPLSHFLIKLSLNNSIVSYAFDNVSIMEKLHPSSNLFAYNSFYYGYEAERNRTIYINSPSIPEYSEGFNSMKILFIDTLRVPN